MDVPQILEQNVDVIKVTLKEQCQQMRFFLLRACGAWAVGSTGRACIPTVSPTRECRRILSASEWSHLSGQFRFCVLKEERREKMTEKIKRSRDNEERWG